MLKPAAGGNMCRTSGGGEFLWYRRPLGELCIPQNSEEFPLKSSSLFFQVERLICFPASQDVTTWSQSKSNRPQPGLPSWEIIQRTNKFPHLKYLHLEGINPMIPWQMGTCLQQHYVSRSYFFHLLLLDRSKWLSRIVIFITSVQNVLHGGGDGGSETVL